MWKISTLLFQFLLFSASYFASAGTSTEMPPRFRVLVLAESGGHHFKYSQAARIGIDKLVSDSSLTVDYLYTWREKSMKAFQDFMKRDNAGWMGSPSCFVAGGLTIRDGISFWTKGVEQK